MAYIYVNKPKFKAIGDISKSSEKSLRQIGSSFKSIGARLDWDVKCVGEINRTINKINNELENERIALSKITSFLSFAARQYEALDIEGDSFKKFISKAELVVKTNPIIGGILDWFNTEAAKKIKKFIDDKKTLIAKVGVDFALRIAKYKSITSYKVGVAIKASYNKIKANKETFTLKAAVGKVTTLKNLKNSTTISRLKGSLTIAKKTISKTLLKTSLVSGVLETAEGIYYGIKNKEPLEKIISAGVFDFVAGAAKGAAYLAVSTVVAGAVAATLPVTGAVALGVGIAAGGVATGLIGSLIGTPNGEGLKLIKDNGGEGITIRDWVVNSTTNAYNDIVNTISSKKTGARQITIERPVVGLLAS